MEILIIGIFTAFNFIVILWKYEKGRTADYITDLTIFAIIAVLFSGTITGLAVGMVASFIVSLYLLVNPPKLKATNVPS